MADPKKKRKTDEDWPEGKPWESESLKPKPKPRPRPSPTPPATGVSTTPTEEAVEAEKGVEAVWSKAKKYFGPLGESFSGTHSKKKKKPSAAAQKNAFEEE